MVIRRVLRTMTLSSTPTDPTDAQIWLRACPGACCPRRAVHRRCDSGDELNAGAQRFDRLDRDPAADTWRRGAERGRQASGWTTFGREHSQEAVRVEAAGQAAQRPSSAAVMESLGGGWIADEALAMGDFVYEASTGDGLHGDYGPNTSFDRALPRVGDRR